MPGLSTIRGGGIATKIKGLIKATNNELNYSIITTIEEAEHADVNFFEDLGVDVFGVSLSRNPVLDIFRIFNCVPKSRFDIIHFHTLPLVWDIRFGFSTGSLFFRKSFRNVVLVYEHQIATVGSLHPIDQGRQYAFFRLLLPLWRTVIVNSKYMLDEALKIIKRPFSEKIKLLPLGVDCKEIQDSTPLHLDGPSILFFGHLSYIKGTDILVKAFQNVNQRYPEIHLHLIGDGPLRGFCEDFVKKENLDRNVHFWGAQPQSMVFGALRGADICVLPSRNDAGPFTTLEAMAAGKPIVTTCRGGIPEFVKDGRNGIVVDPEPDQLARAIEFLLDDSDLRRKIGRNNSEDAKKYSWKRASEEYVKTYLSLVGRGEANRCFPK
jgi:glycosyltransferase involved in cell wall biosynthesis